MPVLHSLLLVSEDEALRSHLRPMQQWIDFHAPNHAIEALERIDDYEPDVIVLDARAINTMILALLKAIRGMPKYMKTPIILLGKTNHAQTIKPQHHVEGKFRLFRLEEKIAEAIGIRLPGRAHHGPHGGAVS